MPEFPQHTNRSANADAVSLFLADQDATTALGGALSEILKPGDTLLLEGPIGAGKSQLARAIIQTLLAAEDRWEDVPSPTFTLIQSYETATTQIVHADLYRLGDPVEVFELGLDTAFDTAICLVEWPDRLGSEQPAQALTLTFQTEGDGRRIFFQHGGGWADRLRPILGGDME